MKISRTVKTPARLVPEVVEVIAVADLSDGRQLTLTSVAGNMTSVLMKQHGVTDGILTVTNDGLHLLDPDVRACVETFMNRPPDDDAGDDV